MKYEQYNNKIIIRKLLSEFITFQTAIYEEYYTIVY